MWAVGSPLAKSAFTTVVSSKRRFPGHAGALEAHGVTLALGRMLRAHRRHSRRRTLLIDARAVLGAISKGRSSTPTLRREVRNICASLVICFSNRFTSPRKITWGARRRVVWFVGGDRHIQRLSVHQQNGAWRISRLQNDTLSKQVINPAFVNAAV